MASSQEQLLELDIEGMTCTACARRVEKSLNKLPGVSAYVDFATEKAHVTFAESFSAATAQTAAGATKVSHDQLTELKTAVESAGYRVGEGKAELQSLKPRLIGGAILSAPSILLGMVPWFQFDGYHLVLMALATPAIFWVAWPFHYAAVKNLRHGDTTMDTLISLGSSVAYLYSVYLVLMGHTHTYFEVATVVPSVVLLGRYIEVRARRSATDSVRALLSAIPDSATLLAADGARTQVASSTLKPGNRVSIAAGERVPVDGTIESGSSAIDNSTLTGESLPIEVSPGDSVAAGATNLASELIITATATSTTNRIARIADLVREATAQKTKLIRIVDRISSVFVPAVIALSVISYLVWAFGFDNPTRAFEAAVTVLVIACPCALGIAVPMSLAVATGVGTKRSVVIRNPDSLNQLAKIKRVAFDKTGTLTDGLLNVQRVHSLANHTEAELLAIASSVEAGSKHPIAIALAANKTELVAENRVETAGLGVSAEVAGVRYSVVKPSEQQLLTLRATGVEPGPNTLVLVLAGDDPIALIELSDQLRPNARVAVERLRELGLTPVLLSGDNPERVAAVALELGIEEHHGGMTPEQKLEFLTNHDEPVAMVGDGINDVAALAASEVGVAMGSGSHAAQAASAITVLDDDPRNVAFAFELALRTHRNVWQNLGWAFGYNVSLIPVAALGFLNPMLAGAAMAFSSVSVVANSLRLRRVGSGQAKN
jgi:P-type Cu+ transporter